MINMPSSPGKSLTITFHKTNFMPDCMTARLHDWKTIFAEEGREACPDSRNEMMAYREAVIV